MKKLVFAIIIGTFCSAAFAKLTNASGDVVVKDDVEYTRRGSMGTKNYTVTDVNLSNCMRKGVNSWIEDETAEDWEPIDGIYGMGIVWKPTGGMTIVDPVSGQQVSSAWYCRQEGWSFLTVHSTAPEGFTYYSCGKDSINCNQWFSYGTNTVNEGCKSLMLPNKESSQNNAATKQYNKEIFADRSWVIEILKAYKNGKLVINDDGTIVIND